jgi:hypothetical protein
MKSNLKKDTSLRNPIAVGGATASVPKVVTTGVNAVMVDQSVLTTSGEAAGTTHNRLIMTSKELDYGH